MLRNPAYRGRAAFGKTKVVPRNKPTKLARDNGPYTKHAKGSSRQKKQADWISISVPAIISDNMFARAAERLTENKKLSIRNNNAN